jgi:hypothetical protein
MTKLDEARNTLKQHAALIDILDKFYWDGDIGHVMYFTVDESTILAEYLINNGIVVTKVKENDKC